MRSLFGIALVALAATTGDYVWYANDVRHTVSAGLLHGVVLLTVVGTVLGAVNGQWVRGLPVGALAGLGGAASYYLLAAIVGRRAYSSAIPVAWVVMWFLLASVEGRWLRAPDKRSWRAVAIRGLGAAVGSGIAFALVMNTLWGRPPDGGRHYGVQFLAWAWAWAPGLLVLLGGSAARRPIATVPAFSTQTAPLHDAPVESSISPSDLLERIDRGDAVHVLDVRSEGEFRSGHVPGAVNVPFSSIGSHGALLPGTPADELIVYCGHGPRAYIAAVALRRLGRSRLVFMSGHWAAWERAGLRVSRDE